MHSMVFHDEGFIIFGGGVEMTPSTWTTTVARLDEKTKNWSKLGDLVTARTGHRVIYDGETFLVVGGRNDSYSIKTEGCQVIGQSMLCAHRKPLLDNYYYPELFLLKPAK